MPHFLIARYLPKVGVPIVYPVVDLFFGSRVHLPGLLLKLNSKPIEGIILIQLLALPDLEVKWHRQYDLFARQFVVLDSKF